MSAHAPDSATPETVEASANKPLIVLCPYCGNTQTRADRCEACGGYFEPLSRQATQIAMGPWFVRDRQQPFRPGCSYETIKKMIAAGRITPTTIIRGPSTHQFWSLARNIRGISHLLGYCHNCHAHVKATDMACATCGATLGDLQHQRNRLELMYPTEQTVQIAKAKLETALKLQNAQAASDASASAGRDLLDMALKPSSQDPTPSPQNASTSAVATPPVEKHESPPDASQPAPAQPSPRVVPPASQTPASEQAVIQPASLNAMPEHAPSAPAAGISPVLLVLIGLNVLLMAGVALLFFLLR